MIVICHILALHLMCFGLEFFEQKSSGIKRKHLANVYITAMVIGYAYVGKGGNHQQWNENGRVAKWWCERINLKKL
jgi:hypothetical protein